MQPAAIRKRNQRERERQRLVSVVTSPAAAPTAPPPVAAPGSTGPAPSPASDVTRSSSSSARLLETEVVTGPGADAFAGATVLGADESGVGGTPLITPEPPAPPPVTSPEEAAMIGKAVATFCRFGWGELATRHQRDLSLVVPDPRMQAAVFEGGLAMVEQSATNLAIKYNVRIPWGDELVVGLGVGTAAFGIVGKLRGDKDKDAANDNHARVTRDVPRPAAAPVTPDQPSILDDEPIIKDTPSATAAATGATGELVL